MFASCDAEVERYELEGGQGGTYRQEKDGKARARGGGGGGGRSTGRRSIQKMKRKFELP